MKDKVYVYIIEDFIFMYKVRIYMNLQNMSNCFDLLGVTEVHSGRAPGLSRGADVLTEDEGHL